MFREMTFEQLVAKTCERTPIPGGGNVGAGIAALGAGLAAMAARFTTGDKFAAVESQVTPLVAQFDRLSRRFVDLMEADAAAYNRYSEARKLPKDTPEQKERRRQAVAQATAEASAVPQEVLTECLNGLRFVKDLQPIANVRLAGDVGAAAYFMGATSQVVCLNIYENAGSMEDAAQRDAIRAKALETAKACAELSAEIGRKVRIQLGIPEDKA